jgi:hypothetical protein
MSYTAGAQQLVIVSTTYKHHKRKSVEARLYFEGVTL